MQISFKIDTTRLEVLSRGYAKNICLYIDGTLRPALGHNATCKWKFDGQVWYHA